MERPNCLSRPRKIVIHARTRIDPFAIPMKRRLHLKLRPGLSTLVLDFAVHVLSNSMTTVVEQQLAAGFGRISQCSHTFVSLPQEHKPRDSNWASLKTGLDTSRPDALMARAGGQTTRSRPPGDPATTSAQRPARSFGRSSSVAQLANVAFCCCRELYIPVDRSF